MRWDRLLADIEAAEAARSRNEMIGEAAERTRLETARITLEARLRAAVGLPLTFEIDGPQRCHGVLDAVGRGWLAVESGAASWLIASDYLVWVADLPVAAAPPEEGPAARVYDGLDLRHVLRGIAADRAAVHLGLGPGEPLTGTIDRVGADFVDLAVHPVGEPRRAREVRGRRSVRTNAIRYLRRDATR